MVLFRAIYRRQMGTSSKAGKYSYDHYSVGAIYPRPQQDNHLYYMVQSTIKFHMCTCFVIHLYYLLIVLKRSN
jgi:hypothetical protein